MPRAGVSAMVSGQTASQAAAQPRQMPLQAQLARSAELDRLRAQRPLSAAEQAEADNLAHRAYSRAWRQRFKDLNGGVPYWKARS